MSNRPSHDAAQLTGEPIVEVTRGGVVESIHHVALCAVDRHGGVQLAAGSIDVPVFLRSSAKPFIAAAAVAARVVERFGLTPREIAVMAASHTGQAFHVDAVRSILRKIDLDEAALQCGPHAPYNAQAAQALHDAGTPFTAVHNNCSGKHAGILALCKAIGADTATYMDVANPAQQTILAFCARMSGDDPALLPLGVDGCGIPVYATPLRRAALAFSRFASLDVAESDAAALETVRAAMLAHPEYVSGTGEFDTCLMQAAGGAIACKGGAEGVHCSSLLDSGTGLAVKVVDGASRGRAPAVLSALCALGAPGAVLSELTDFARPALYNRARRAIGEVHARPVLSPSHQRVHENIV